MSSPSPPHPPDSPPVPARTRAITSAELSLSLFELMRAGALLPRAITAIAVRRRQRNDPLAPLFDRLAVSVREQGWSLSQAVAREQAHFTSRFVALVALAHLGGSLFHTFVQRLREFVDDFNALPTEAAHDFPPMRDEVREFCFFLGHLIRERASQPEVQRWLPEIFTPRVRYQTTLVLGRFYDQGLLLSEAFLRTPPFHDAEMVLAVQAGEARNEVGRELIDLADWLEQRRKLEERLRLAELVLPGLGFTDGRPQSPPSPPPDRPPPPG